jgi:phospholipase D1/2
VQVISWKKYKREAGRNTREKLAKDREFDGADEELGLGFQYLQMQASPTRPSSPMRLMGDNPIFKESPTATIIGVSRAEGNDLSSAFQLIYTIDFTYQQFKWRLDRKATQVFFLHLALKRRALLEDFQEKQEHVKEWFQNLGIGEPTGIDLHASHEDDDQDDNPASTRKDIPSSAALPVMRPALGRLPTITYRAQNAMQQYLKHFLDSLEIVNTREVCRFLEVSKLSFSPEYGPKLHEGYVMVQHLPKFSNDEETAGCSSCFRSCCCCNPNWQRVWAVLKPGFLALLADPFNGIPLDIILFDVLSPSDRGATEGLIALARLNKERNPLRFSFTITCGNRAVKLRTRRAGSSKDWVASINDAGLRPPEGWCHPHRYSSFAPPRGFSDGSEAQWFIDGRAAFEAIATAIENARSEIFIAGWWLCPDLYLRRPFGTHEASRLDHLLESKAKTGVQIYILMYKEVALALKINSNYSKQRLLGLHENIKVLRFPDHFSSGVYLWSHHEKLVIVDHHVCFLGGLDLCFGRYDSPEHQVSDFPSQMWPGKDYYNPRESEPNSWEDAMKDELDRQKFPRMPWHDVHCALWGPPCRDVARHFVQRWNYAKRNKAPNELTIPLLLPQHHMVIPHYLTGDSLRWLCIWFCCTCLDMSYNSNHSALGTG